QHGATLPYPGPWMPPRSSDTKSQPCIKQLLQTARASPTFQDGLQIAVEGLVGMPHGPGQVLLCEGEERGSQHRIGLVVCEVPGRHGIVDEHINLARA